MARKKSKSFGLSLPDISAEAIKGGILGLIFASITALSLGERMKMALSEPWAWLFILSLSVFGAVVSACRYMAAKTRALEAFVEERAIDNVVYDELKGEFAYTDPETKKTIVYSLSTDRTTFDKEKPVLMAPRCLDHGVLQLKSIEGQPVYFCLPCGCQMSYVPANITDQQACLTAQSEIVKICHRFERSLKVLNH